MKHLMPEPYWDSVAANMPGPQPQLSSTMTHPGEQPKLPVPTFGTGFRCGNSSLPIATPGQIPCPVGLPSLSHLFPGHVNGFQRSDSGSILPGFSPENESINPNGAAARWSAFYPRVAAQAPMMTVDGSIFHFAPPPTSTPGCYDFGAPLAMPFGYTHVPPALGPGSMPNIPYTMGSGLVGPLYPIQAHFQSMADLASNPFLYSHPVGMSVAPSMPMPNPSLGFAQEPVSTHSQFSHVPSANPFLATSFVQATPATTIPDSLPTNKPAASLTVSPQHWLSRPSDTLAELAPPAPSAQQTQDVVMSEASHDVQVHHDADSRTGSRGSKRSASKMACDADSDEEVESGTVRSSLFPYDSVDEALAVEYPHFHTITDLRERRLIRNRIAAKACRARKKEVVDELARKLDDERTTAAQLRARCSNLERENNRLMLELGRTTDSSHTVQPEPPSERDITAPGTPKNVVMDHQVPLELPGRSLVMFTTVIPGVTASAAAKPVEDQAHPDEPSDPASQDGLDMLLFAAQHVDYLDFTAAQPPPSEVYQQRACGFRV